MPFELTQVERELIDASMDIGGIYEMNNTATRALALRVEATGKAVGDLTVAELRAITEKLRVDYNASLGHRLSTN